MAIKENKTEKLLVSLFEQLGSVDNEISFTSKPAEVKSTFKVGDKLKYKVPDELRGKVTGGAEVVVVEAPFMDGELELVKVQQPPMYGKEQAPVTALVSDLEAVIPEAVPAAKVPEGKVPDVAKANIEGVIKDLVEDDSGNPNFASDRGVDKPVDPAVAAEAKPVEPKKEFSMDEAKATGEKLGIDWEKSPFDADQFLKGMNVELEHGTRSPSTNITDDGAEMTGKIALAHLNEIKDYYTRLAAMEQEAKDGAAVKGLPGPSMDGAAVVGAPAMSAPLGIVGAMESVNEGAGNYLPPEPWREEEEYEMVYVDWSPKSDYDETESDMAYEQFRDDLENACNVLGLTPVKDEWVDNNTSVFAENDVVKVLLADNQNTVAVVVVPVEQTDENGDVTKFGREYEEVAKKLFTELGQYFELSVRNGPWLSSPSPYSKVKEAVSEDEGDLPFKKEGQLVGWIAIFNGKKVEILKSEASGLWPAKELAAKKLNVPKSKMGLLAIAPAYESKTTLAEASKQYALTKAREFIAAHPELKARVQDLWQLSASEIEDGDSEEEEYEKFLSDLPGLLKEDIGNGSAPASSMNAGTPGSSGVAGKPLRMQVIAADIADEAEAKKIQAGKVGSVIAKDPKTNRFRVELPVKESLNYQKSLEAWRAKRSAK